MKKQAFSSEQYLNLQRDHILERINQFDGKLYLEFGGKMLEDFHAARVLPGYEPDNKIKLLQELKEQVEVVIAINASNIEHSKARGDLGISYDQEVFRLIDKFNELGIFVGSVVITQYAGQPAADAFRNQLEKHGIDSYLHYPIKGYPTDMDHIISPEGMGKNDYIKTSRNLIVVTAPGPGSGKLATCMSNMYHDQLNGIKSGYAKFETFPVWNLPLHHPVNLAYEAATADLGPNGSGKTTLIKLINGLLQPEQGRILINGMEPSPATKAIVSYLPDTTYLNDQMKVKEALTYFKTFYQDFNLERAQQLLNDLGIDQNSRFKKLSKGNKEKVQLILVMSRDARLYVLDEPSGGVDPAARDYILNTIINNYSPTSTVLISTHLISDIEPILDEIIFLKDGKVVRQGNVDDIRYESGESIDQLFRHEFKA